MPTLVPTAGAANANTYVSLDEATAYFESRVPLDPPWDPSGELSAAALIMATRVLDSMSVARRRLVLDGRGGPSGRPYYITSRAWTGEIATQEQSLAWPRSGMYDRLGRVLSDSVIPAELKDAQSELAGQLLISDTTLDNDVIVQGIKEIRAASVQLKFKDMVETKVLPDAVMNLMPPSWFTDEIIESSSQMSFLAL